MIILKVAAHVIRKNIGPVVYNWIIRPVDTLVHKLIK